MAPNKKSVPPLKGGGMDASGDKGDCGSGEKAFEAKEHAEFSKFICSIEDDLCKIESSYMKGEKTAKKSRKAT